MSGPADRKPGARRRALGPVRAFEVVDGPAANAAKHETLQRRLLQRRARSAGLTLRHSEYGYSLVDAEQNRADGRNDMTLRDVARHLDRL